MLIKIIVAPKEVFPSNAIKSIIYENIPNFWHKYATAAEKTVKVPAKVAVESPYINWKTEQLEQ